MQSLQLQFLQLPRHLLIPRAASCRPQNLLLCRGSASIRYPITPHSKAKIESKKLRPHKNWKSFNDPRLMPKYLRFAERTARELGVVDDVADFDEKAAAFPNPTPIIVATLVERANVIMRDLALWEENFLYYKSVRDDAEAKQLPQQYLDILTASTNVMEGGGGAGGGADKAEKKKDAPGEGASQQEGEAASQGGASATGGGGAAAAKAAGNAETLSAFYGGSSAAPASAAADEQQKRDVAGLAIAPRTTPADEIGDTRSLDRAYTQRLALLVKDASSGAWGLPEGARLEGEPMVQAAQRCLRQAWGADPALDLWYIGRAPVGHVLRVYSPEEQAASGCYGAKVFIYRAELIAGRFRLPAAGGGRYSDFGWYTRDEAEGVLARPLWKYLHQVIAGGPGEELAREDAWKRRIEARGLSVAQASGRRAFRLNSTRLSHAASKASGAPRTAGYRMRAVATREQAALASIPWKGEQGAAKSAALAAAGDAYHARVATQKGLSAVLAKELATPTAAFVAAQRRQQKKLQEQPQAQGASDA